MVPLTVEQAVPPPAEEVLQPLGAPVQKEAKMARLQGAQAVSRPLGLGQAVAGPLKASQGQQAFHSHIACWPPP